MIAEAFGPGFELTLAVALGLILGSFANVCIHRLPERRSVVRPGSSCPACGTPILWYDNIPVVSWVLLGAKCRRCRQPIPARYPLIELLAAALLAALCLRHGLTARWAALSWLCLSILILIPIDMKHGILPDRVTLTGLAAGLALSPLSDTPGWRGAILGAAVGGFVPLAVRALYILRARVRRPAAAGPQESPEGAPAATEEFAEERREGMGLGDVKMLAMVGAFLGPAGALLTMLLGSVLGTLYVLPLLAAGRRGLGSPLPFGPFLGIAALVGVFWGGDIVAWYARLMGS